MEGKSFLHQVRGWKGAMLLLDYNLLIGGQAWSSLSGYLNSSCLFAHDCLRNQDQQQPPTTKSPQQPILPLGTVAFLYRLRNSPQNSKGHTIRETFCSWQNQGLAGARSKS